MAADADDARRSYDVFISYARADRDFVVRLTDELSAARVNVFLDCEDLTPGDSWPTALRRAIKDSKAAVVVLSTLPGKVASHWQDQELRYMRQLRAERDFRVIPVLLDNIEPDSMPYELRDLHGIRADRQRPEEIAKELIRILPRAPKGFERVSRFWSRLWFEQPAGSADDVTSEALIALSQHFFEAAGRDAQSTPDGIDLSVPEPVVCRERPTPDSVDRVVAALPQGGVGYLVHRHVLASEVELRLDHARLHGVPIAMLPERIMSAALADGNARSVLGALTADARSSQNLFRTRNSVIDRRFLFGRNDILSRIGTALRDGEHILLSGSRKSGKTSVLNILRQDLDDHPVVALDLQLIDRKDSRWPGRLFTDILVAYDRWGAVRFVGDWPKDEPKAEDGLAFRDLLALRREWHASRGPVANLLLLLDELERLLPLEGETDVADHFARATGALRAVGQGNDRWLSIIAADLRPSANRMNRLPGGITNPFFQFFQELPLPLLDRSAIAELVRTLARMMGAPDVDDDVVQRVLGLSGGHPWVARAIAGAAWERRTKPNALVADDIERGLEHLYDDDTLGHFFRTNFWAAMTSAEQAALATVARGSDGGALTGDVRASLRRQGLLVDGTIPIAAFAEWVRDVDDQSYSERVG